MTERKILSNKRANDKKAEQLGMPFGTACGRLRKMVLFEYVKKCGENVCYRCKKNILTAEELSIEHKESFLDSDNPAQLFFDLNNIAFSHLRCNSAAGRKPKKCEHGSALKYAQGCRCDKCTEANTKKVNKWRRGKKIKTTL